MRSRKTRVTVTLDKDLLRVASAAVKAGEANSLSEWLNAALADKVAERRRREAMRAAIEDYEAEFGVITEEAMDRQVRLDRARAIRVRPKRARRAG
jgi:Arc/MetJ-type ribon-helix-helix transcriptional regulator